MPHFTFRDTHVWANTAILKENTNGYGELELV